ncbi:MAG: MOSC domain-containing protein [Bacteroidetes bacterium]|nr:MAG: MOSC domain-containing protein [Bacteroidota bacterium]
MQVVELFEYPVKGLLGNSLCCAGVNKRGLAMDRRWMLADESGNFLSQRQLPSLTQFLPDFHDKLTIKHLPSGSEISIETSEFNQIREVEVWGQQCTGHGTTNEINEWLSNKLDQKVSLIYMDEHDIRPIKSANEGEIVSFADGYPILLTTMASLNDLNSRLDTPILMNRFRPNIVIDGDIPFAEDNWQRVRVGGITFKVAKKCARCHVINIDQSTGLSTKEPLKTLSTYRKEVNKVNFGVNLIPELTGIIHDKDEVEILD